MSHAGFYYHHHSLLYVVQGGMGAALLKQPSKVKEVCSALYHIYVRTYILCVLTCTIQYLCVYISVYYVYMIVCVLRILCL